MSEMEPQHDPNFDRHDPTFERNTPVEIRCPYLRPKNRYGKKLETCNKLRLRARPGSSGVSYCDTCKKSFDFEVQSSGDVETRRRA
jgi:hypothetical protein